MYRHVVHMYVCTDMLYMCVYRHVSTLCSDSQLGFGKKVLDYTRVVHAVHLTYCIFPGIIFPILG